MPQGVIKKLVVDRGFGFISTGRGKGDRFFHYSAVQGTTIEQLHVGQRVEFDEVQGPKGPRAENVRPI